MAFDRKQAAGRFLRGLASGALGSLFAAGIVLFALHSMGKVSFAAQDDPGLRHWADWVIENLGSSIPVFAALLLAFVVTISRLRQKLRSEAPTNEIVQLDHLSDIWTTLFFGTGVIWTAIGMRGALIFALGEPGESVQEGAFAVLQRMVDGGILLALSTTIFGGIGGYLMRVYKSVALGARLQSRYDKAARIDTESMNNSLRRIEHFLHRRAAQTEPGSE